MKSKVRFAIIGLGNIGKVHLENLRSGKVSDAVLTAVCTTRKPSIELPAEVRSFTDARAMLQSGLVDAVIVATPHPQHRGLGTMVLEQGLHLLMEKPLAATKLDGEKLLAIPRKPGQQFGIMLNLRTHPDFRRIKELLDSDQLGTLQRVHWTNTDWFRPDAYFALSNWRATWKGEGGGVLVNQALHNLDILQWLVGMPQRLMAHCHLGQEHDIEVEDHVTSYMEFGNGATGTFITSTGEAPGVNRLEIAGTRALIILDENGLRISRNTVDARAFSRTTDNAFGGPETKEEILTSEADYPSHVGVLNNFVAAIQGNEPLMADAREGLLSVELANAMLLSSWQKAMVDIPIDSETYEAALNEAIANSKPRERKIRAATVDMSKSYSRTR